MIVDAEVGGEPLSNKELGELELQARLGSPDPVLVLRLVNNGTDRAQTETERAYQEGYDEAKSLYFDEGYDEGYAAGQEDADKAAKGIVISLSAESAASKRTI
jgi:hypothetical protein